MGSPFGRAAGSRCSRWLVRRPHVLVPEVLRILWASRGSAYALAGHVGYLPAAARVAALAEREGFERIHGAWAHFPASVAYLAARLVGPAIQHGRRTRAPTCTARRPSCAKRCATRTSSPRACAATPSHAARARAAVAACEWLYHGTDLARFGAIERARAESPTLLVVGRLAPREGIRRRDARAGRACAPAGFPRCWSSWARAPSASASPRSRARRAWSRSSSFAGRSRTRGCCRSMRARGCCWRPAT